MSKQIEDITDEDLEALWPVIGGAPHLFEYGKDELRKVLITGECADEDDEPIGLQLDYYTMAAIVSTLQERGFDTPSATDEALFPREILQPLYEQHTHGMKQVSAYSFYNFLLKQIKHT